LKEGAGRGFSMGVSTTPPADIPQGRFPNPDHSDILFSIFFLDKTQYIVVIKYPYTI